MIALAETLREARQGAGLTQRQVADALAVPHTYPSRWERGVTRPGPANLLALAELYGLDAAALLRLYAAGPAARQPAPAVTPRASGTADADAAAALGRAVADAASEANPPQRRRRAPAAGGAAAGGSSPT